MLPSTTRDVARSLPAVQLKRRVFVGSSLEGVKHAEHIAQLLTSDTTECRLWSTFFQPGYLTFEALEQMLAECCAAVFIATPDDKATIRDRTVSVPRANIMLEFGLVAGRLGRHNIAVCRYGGTELPSDLKGFTVIEMEPGFTPADASPAYALDFTKRAEDTLTTWSSGLLATAEMIPRTDTVHGYTGRWTFDMHLDHWRGVEISDGSYCVANGSLELWVDSTGKTGHGYAFGRLTFKLANGPDGATSPFQGELGFGHEITNVVCDVHGGIRFTSRTSTLQAHAVSGHPIPEIGTLDAQPEPWPFGWELDATSEPKMLCGSITADNPGHTSGEVRLVKADYL